MDCEWLKQRGFKLYARADFEVVHDRDQVKRGELYEVASGTEDDGRMFKVVNGCSFLWEDSVCGGTFTQVLRLIIKKRDPDWFDGLQEGVLCLHYKLADEDLWTVECSSEPRALVVGDADLRNEIEEGHWQDASLGDEQIKRDAAERKRASFLKQLAKFSKQTR